MRIPGFLFEEECLAFLRELRNLAPAGFEELSFTPAEQFTFDEIVRHKTFRGYRDGQEVGVCIFQPDLTVTMNGQPFGWQIEEDKENEAVLILTEDGRRMSFLRKTSQGSWAGYWRYGERSSIVLATDYRQDLHD